MAGMRQFAGLPMLESNRTNRMEVSMAFRIGENEELIFVDVPEC